MTAAPRYTFLGRDVSPITARRLANFRANKRGFWSLWIFLVFFVLSLFAEVIANDDPIAVWYDGGLYAPILQDYPETAFGGECETKTDYSDPFVEQQIADNGFMIRALIPYDHQAVDWHLTEPAPTPPGADHWLGTDDQARDVVARVIYGFRISVLFGLAMTALTTLIGVTAGAIQGYFGGWTDLIFQRVMEVFGTLPMLMVLIILEPRSWSRTSGGCWASWCCSAGRGRSATSARSSCARATSTSSESRQGAGRLRLDGDVPPHPAQRHGRHAHLPAVHADRARSPP